MADEILPFEIPTNKSSIIKVLGVGGGGGNAVNHMYKQGIEGVDFMICNTDAQALSKSTVPVRIQLGITLTEGLGAGNRPERGREAAVESVDDLKHHLGTNTKMLFVTAGMGGGTGTGAAPVIAQVAKDMDILTIGIVTIPFRFEGRRRINQAIEGIAEMSKYVDSLLIVNNEKIREMYGNLGQKEAFGKADDVLTTGAKSIAEIITKDGHVNVDFADVKTVMSDSGVALMGAGEGEGEDRAKKAVQAALNSPLLNNNDISGAKNLLLNITSGTSEASMDEIGFINDYVQERAGNSADLIWGSSDDPDLGEKIAVTVIATGFETNDIPEVYVSTEKAASKEPDFVINGFPPIDEDVKTEQVSNEIKINDNKPTKSTLGNNEITLSSTNKSNNQPNTTSAPEEISSTKTSIPANQFEKGDLNARFTKTRLNEIKAAVQNSNSQVVETAEYNKNIDKYEEVPAYQRKNIKLDFNKVSDSDKVSSYILSGTGSNTTISDNNRYLHDKVD